MAQGEKVQRTIDEFVSMMKTKAGENLLSMIVYGSAATNEYSEKYSDVNILCVLARLDGEDLRNIASAMQWWERHGRAALVLSLDELTRSADVFAIELLDIKEHHRILYGQDVVAGIEVPLTLHRIQVERELRMALIRLRQRFLSGAHDRRALVQLLIASSSTFNTLLRHALIALGHTPPQNRHEVADAIQTVLASDMSPLRTVLDVRDGKITERNLDPEKVFGSYLDALSAIVDKVDRQLSA
ncbi:MAG TPA: hypothetical protein VN622_06070 [Clostridia bacterium]|nr:hypothetical protein [Clostridia bacterium]